MMSVGANPGVHAAETMDDGIGVGLGVDVDVGVGVGVGVNGCGNGVGVGTGAAMQSGRKISMTMKRMTSVL